MSLKFALVKIPGYVSFTALELRRDPHTGRLDYNPAVLRDILAANEHLTFDSEAEIIELLSEWYCSLKHHGYYHPVAEEMLLPLDPDPFSDGWLYGVASVH